MKIMKKKTSNEFAEFIIRSRNSLVYYVTCAIFFKEYYLKIVTSCSIGLNKIGLNSRLRNNQNLFFSKNIFIMVSRESPQLNHIDKVVIKLNELWNEINSNEIKWHEEKKKTRLPYNTKRRFRQPWLETRNRSLGTWPTCMHAAT